METEQLRNVSFNLQICFMKTTLFPLSLYSTVLALIKQGHTTIMFLLLYKPFHILNCCPHIEISKARNVKTNLFSPYP